MGGATNDNYNPESIIDLGPTDDLPQEFKYVEPPGAGITEGKNYRKESLSKEMNIIIMYLFQNCYNFNPS